MTFFIIAMPIYFVAVLAYGAWYETSGRSAEEFARIRREEQGR